MAEPKSTTILGRVVLKKCKCKHAFQDERYNKGIRVHNTCKEGKARCTVCSDVKTS